MAGSIGEYFHIQRLGWGGGGGVQTEGCMIAKSNFEIQAKRLTLAHIQQTFV